MLDLDDADALAQRSLRPSRVVTRDRATTQRWARAAFDEAQWSGVAWWSYHDPDWMSCGLWSAVGARAIDGLTVIDRTDLSADHPAVVAASQSLLRVWVP